MAAITQVLTVGELARLVGRSIQTIRQWDASGKLPAKRTATGQRYYSPKHVEAARKLIANNPNPYWRGRDQAQG